MVRLRIERVRSSSRLSGALSPGQAEQYGEFDGEILDVDSEAVAQELAQNSNVEVVSSDVEGGVNGDETTIYCGVNGCKRKVDSQEDTCWQHSHESQE
jgi:hypothetical protein